MNPCRKLIHVAVLFACSLSAGLAQPQLYVLDETSRFEQGCFEGCSCPVSTYDMLGTMRLEFTGFDGLFFNYDVTDVDFTVFIGPSVMPVRGDGTYRIGGEFARMHELALDLRVGDEPLTRFDSGLLIGGSEFPRIDIAINMNDLICYDTVLTIVADPAPPCDGDLDGDYDRDLGDLAILLSEFGSDCRLNGCRGDLNGDGVVDLEDLSRLLALFGTSCR